MIKSAVLNKEFASKEELFKELKQNEKKLISLKKAAIKKSEGVNYSEIKLEATKGIQGIEDGFIYPVINTTRYMDSHDDVHMDGLWKKSLQEQKGKIFYVSNHSLEVDDVVAWPEDVEAFVQDIPWTAVGKDFKGTTQALIFKIDKSKLKKKKVVEAITEKRPLENSVRMCYVQITLAIDANEKEYAGNKAYYDAHINEIANKEQVMEQGYFFGVDEAKIYKEGSVVLFGSNDATGIIYPEPQKALQLEEPSKDTLTVSELKLLIKQSLK